MSGLSQGYTLNWQPAKAELLTVDALERSRRALGEDHPETGVLTVTLGWIYEQLNHLEKAKELTLRSWELRRSVLGDDSPRTLSSFLLLARVHVQQGRLDEADPRADEALSRIRGHPAVLDDLYLPYQVCALGWAYLEQGHVAKADTLCSLALEAMRRKTDSSPVLLPVSSPRWGRFASHRRGTPRPNGCYARVCSWRRNAGPRRRIGST